MTSLKKSAAQIAASVFCGSGSERLIRARRRSRGDHRVFILAYHDVGPEGEEREGVISAPRLRDHLRFLKARYRIASLSEAAARLRGPQPLTEDFVAITFDDGYAGNYAHAWPVLRDEQVPATIFLTTGFVDGNPLWFDLAVRCQEVAQAKGISALPSGIDGLPQRFDPREAGRLWQMLERLTPERREPWLRAWAALCGALPSGARPLSWTQAREMIAGGCDFGAHTVTHTVLSALTPAQQRDEIRASAARIAECLGKAPTCFAYPNGDTGDFDESALEALRNTGLDIACTTVRGSNSVGSDLLRLKRHVIGADSRAVLATRLAGVFETGARAFAGRAAPMRIHGASAA